MPGSHELAVWLYGMQVATIAERRSGKISLAYSDEAKQRWRGNEPVLSISMPVDPGLERYPPAVAMPYLEGLLPEGEARTTLERRFEVPRGDTFALLAEIGHDCAGAVVFQRPGDPLPVATSTAGVTGRPLSGDEIADEIERLGTHPLGVDGDVRLSLAGLQEKLLLCRSADGDWTKPVASAPSTHILKPQDERHPAMVANEALCLRTARELGLTTIEVETIDARGRQVLVVSRYDRYTDEAGLIQRIHQEDFCQALGIRTDVDAHKYESNGGPSLEAVARVLDAYAEDGLAELTKLLKVVTLNVAVGNADAHGKNLSLLHDRSGTVTLAPVYDVMSTTHYQTVATPQGPRPVSRNLAMAVNRVPTIDDIATADLVAEGRAWGLSVRHAAEEVEVVLGELSRAIDRAAEHTPHAPGELVARLRGRAQALLDGRVAGAGDPERLRVG